MAPYRAEKAEWEFKVFLIAGNNIVYVENGLKRLTVKMDRQLPMSRCLHILSFAGHRCMGSFLILFRTGREYFYLRRTLTTGGRRNTPTRRHL